MKKFLTYAKSILLPIILGSLIGLIVNNFMDYENMAKPFLSPPSNVFPIAWTILYALMGISYAILKTNNLESKDISKIYYIQLIVNLLWSIIFFVFDFKLFAFLWIILLIYLVIIMIKKFYEANKLAGLLQIPYLIWLIFAAYLNIAIYLLENNIIS